MSLEKLECLKLAVMICHREANNKPDDMIALAEKLCNYVEGDSPNASSSGGEGKLKKQNATPPHKDPFK